MLKQSRLEDLAYSLSCDPRLSVISNAFPEVLEDVLGSTNLEELAAQDSLQVGTAVSVSSVDYAERLNDAFFQVVGPATQAVILVRVHGYKTAKQLLDEFAGWKKTFNVSVTVNYWDVFEPAMQAGHERFTVLAAV